MHILDTLLSSIAPRYCSRCDAAGPLLFEACLVVECDNVVPLRCCMCHAPTKESKTCKKCRSQYGLLKNVWVYARYDSETKRLIYVLKYGRVLGAASVIASLLGDTLPCFGPSSTVFVSIPTPPARVRARGLDHTLLIAKELSTIRDIPVATPLFRSTNTQQVGASRKLRLSQFDGAVQYKNFVQG